MAPSDGSPTSAPPPAGRPASGSVVGIALDRLVTVTFASPRALTDDDVAAVRRAARVLLDELRTRGLTPAQLHPRDV